MSRLDKEAPTAHRVYFTRDVVKMARSKKAMEESLKALNENANEVGLSINQEKTKYLEIKTKEAI